MPQIVLTSTFCYGHRLLGYNGKCSRLHGHNARLEVTLHRDELDEQGFVMDFTEAKEIIKEVVSWFDHYMILQEGDPVVELLQTTDEDFKIMHDKPTAENIAFLITGRLTGAFFEHASRIVTVAQVKLWETDNNYVIVE